MDYLQSVVYRALCNNPNPNLDKEYAKRFAEHRINAPIDLVSNLDFECLDLVAVELGCTSDEIDTFLMVTKALWNCGKCERTAAENRFLSKSLLEIANEIAK